MSARPLPPWVSYLRMMARSGYGDGRIAEGVADRYGREVSRWTVLRARRRLGLPANRPGRQNLAEYRATANAAYCMSAGWPQLADPGPAPAPREVDILCHLLDAGPQTAVQLADALRVAVWHPLSRLLRRGLVVVYRRVHLHGSGRPRHVYGLAHGVVKPLCHEVY